MNESTAADYQAGRRKSIAFLGVCHAGSELAKHCLVHALKLATQTA
jgi:hypothetical protein